VDERKLSEMFQNAVPDAPPPSFDYDDVAVESGRQRVRRRNALLGGSALGIALLAGATVLGVALWKGTGTTNGVSPANAPLAGGNAEAAPNEVPSEDAGRSASGGAQDRSFSAEVPKQGGPPTGNAGTQEPGSTSSGCGQADGELAAALAGELPSAAPSLTGFREASCSPNVRTAAVRVDGGVVTLLVYLPGAQAGSPPHNAAVRALTTADGRRVVLMSQPDFDGQDPPLENELQGMAERLAASGKF
jgi:hypothetical protein